MINVDLSTITRWGLNVVILFASVIALRLGDVVFLPMVISLLLAAMLWPVVLWLNKKLRLPWTVSCLTVVLGLVLFNLLVILGLGLATVKLVQDLPRFDDIEDQKNVYGKFRNQLVQVAPSRVLEEYFPLDAENSKVFLYIRETLNPSYGTQALLTTFKITNYLFWEWVLIMFVLVFLLLEGPMLTRRVVEIFGPSQEAQSAAFQVLKDMANQVRTYLVWRTIVNFGLALVCGLVYQWMGLKEAWTWAILTAIMCYVPYFGPLAAGVFPVVDAFINLSPLGALGILVFYLIIITLEGYVIVPVVMGRSMELNATTVMLACLVWWLIWDLPGLFLAMPLMAGLKSICTQVPVLRPWANLMSTRTSDIVPIKEEPP